MLPSCGTSILNNFTSPGASGPVGTVAHEEINKIIPPIKKAINKLVARPMVTFTSFQIYPHNHQSHF
jgi:nicotinamidase-related amidase